MRRRALSADNQEEPCKSTALAGRSYEVTHLCRSTVTTAVRARGSKMKGRSSKPKTYEVTFHRCVAVVEVEALNAGQAKKWAMKVLEIGDAQIVEYDFRNSTALPTTQEGEKK